jgi:hypothetical protein
MFKYPFITANIRKVGGNCSLWGEELSFFIFREEDKYLLEKKICNNLSSNFDIISKIVIFGWNFGFIF